MNDKEHIYTLMLIPLFIILLFFVKSTDMYVAAGGFIGFACGYYIEKEYVRYDVKASFWIQVLKVVFGLVVAIAIKEGLKFIFPYSLTEETDPTNFDLFFDFIRYLMIGVWAAAGAPWVFKHAIKHR
jgi:undecaprenyl-diphosphatase